VKLGRIILAGLAPLFSLSAVAAGWMTGNASAAPTGQITAASFAHSLPRLLSVVPYVLAGADQTADHQTTDHGRTHAALFSLEALFATPLEGSLWLLASLFSISLLYRRHACVPLRC
jgi:hypothetical protein